MQYDLFTHVLGFSKTITSAFVDGFPSTWQTYLAKELTKPKLLSKTLQLNEAVHRPAAEPLLKPNNIVLDGKVDMSAHDSKTEKKLTSPKRDSSKRTTPRRSSPKRTSPRKKLLKKSSTTKTDYRPPSPVTTIQHGHRQTDESKIALVSAQPNFAANTPQSHKTTRSGRSIHRPAAYWAQERPRYSYDGTFLGMTGPDLNRKSR